MTVTAQGSTLASNLDIFAQVGAAAAYTPTYSNIPVTNGSLSLGFSSGVSGENAVVSAIDAYPSSGSCGGSSPPISTVLMIIFENTNASDALAQSYMGGLINNGRAAYLGNYHAITHPSQPNYFAIVSGSTQGVTDDNNHNINAQHLGDLLEAKGLNWKVYAEDYPGNCYTGAQSGNYVRKHNPFISFANVNGNATRCNAHIFNSSQFWTDLQNGQLPAFALYIPNLQDDGHDTSVSFADNWLSSTFGSTFSSNSFWALNPLVILTFDENAYESNPQDDPTNDQVYTALFGNKTASGVTSETMYNHYSLTNLIESVFNLGSLGQNDASATPINDIWNGSAP
jgi:hypothetical protein